MVEIIYTRKQLQKRLDYWQRRLRLLDWHLTIAKERRKKMPNEAQAYCQTNRASKISHIGILHESDYGTNTPTPQDMDWSIVHELLHVHISGIKAEEFEWSLQEEQAIDAMAYAYITLDREANA
ncbi:hypothetical protein [uncultured Planococcus sp.]|uniref:hypothetical protein n=1 Tax=uncultured Planococcus sp. TaxID=337815 RepID=UPI002632E11A|nr:hypothetical protein [uncultured Planococcus sp.]